MIESPGDPAGCEYSGFGLSVAQKQIVEICKALSFEAEHDYYGRTVRHTDGKRTGLPVFHCGNASGAGALPSCIFSHRMEEILRLPIR